MKLLLLLFAIVAMVESYTFYLAQIKQNPYWVHHVYMPIEYCFFAFIFSYWQKKSWVRKALRISIPIFALICLWDIFIFNNLDGLNDFTGSIAFTLYVGISAYTLLQLQTDNPRHILRDYRFWISAALLIYSAGGLAFFSFYDIVVNDYLVVVWATHLILNVVVYTLYSVGLVCQTRF